MRDFKGMKRQRGRNRNGGGGNKPTQNVNRAFDSNGPDNVKIRGHAQHVFEKYQQLARDAFGSGDRVLAENYLQHAEHYFRLLRTLQPHRPPAEILGRDSFASGYDIDFEDESGEPIADQTAAEPAPESAEAAGGEGRPEGRPENRYEQRPDNRQEGRRDERDGRPEGRYEGRRDERDGRREFRDRGEYRDNRDRNENRNRDDRFEGRGEGRPRFEGRRDESRQEGRFEGRRDEQRPEGRFEGQGRFRDRGDNRERGENRFDREDRRPDDRRYVNGAEAESRPDPLPVIEPQPVSMTPDQAYDTGPELSGVLRGQDGTVSEAPAFLQGAPPSADDEGRRGRARRPRRPRSFETNVESEGGETPTPEAAES